MGGLNDRWLDGEVSRFAMWPVFTMCSYTGLRIILVGVSVSSLKTRLTEHNKL